MGRGCRGFGKGRVFFGMALTAGALVWIMEFVFGWVGMAWVMGFGGKVEWFCGGFNG